MKDVRANESLDLRHPGRAEGLVSHWIPVRGHERHLGRGVGLVSH